MPIHIEKKGIRALGIAESFNKLRNQRSVLAGIVIRSDFIIDGFIFGNAKIKGNDATDEVVKIFERLRRNDVNVILLGGCVISMYNIIDIESVGIRTKTPVICVTYEESEGLEPHIKRYFPDSWEKKLIAYNKLGSREMIKLHTDYEIFVRNYGINLEQSRRILNKFTIQGSVPEPLKLARLLARARMESM